jgi:hypothetical protein
VKYQIDIAPNGKTVIEVLDRQGEDCTVKTNSLIQGLSVESDERTGPDCDDVHEGVGGGSL